MNPSIFLPAFEANWLGDNRALLPKLRDGRLGARGALAVARNWRRAAIAALLQTGTPATFLRRLQRAGSAFASFLERTTAADLLTSECAPLFCAIAADDPGTALRIAAAAPRDRSDAEYEEDYWWFELTMRLVSDPDGAADHTELLQRWEDCLEGSFDPRLDVARALTAGDGEALGSALVAWLGEVQGTMRELREAAGDPEVLATEAYVSIEGIAVARLARARGLDVPAPLVLVPEPALAAAPAPWPAESFTIVD
ncbi:MAG: Imm49 family immunity protein [Planctomycetota bacterium]